MKKKKKKNHGVTHDREEEEETQNIFLKFPSCFRGLFSHSIFAYLVREKMRIYAWKNAHLKNIFNACFSPSSPLKVG